MYHPQLIRIARTSFRPVLLNPSFSRAYTRMYTVSTPPAPTRKEKQASEHKNLDNVARGLKAAIHNSNVSEVAKDNAARQLKEMGIEAEKVSQAASQSHIRHQLGGYKATLSNPHTSTEAKERARDILEGVSTKNEKRVMAGYKATLKNYRTSKKAKHHAEEVLKEHHVL